MLNRRNLFAAAPAAAILAAMPQAAVAATTESDARLLFWEGEQARLIDEVNKQEASEAETDAMCAQAFKYQAMIAAAPCDSHLALVIKMRTVVKEGLIEGCNFSTDWPTVIGGMIGYLEARA